VRPMAHAPRFVRGEDPKGERLCGAPRPFCRASQRCQMGLNTNISKINRALSNVLIYLL
jgi:hypothetical protein